MATALKLYEAVDQYEVVVAWIEEHAAEIEAAGGELPPELDELLEQVEGTLEEKLGRVGLVVLNLRADEKAQREEARRLEGAARTSDRQATTLREYIRQQLRRIGLARVDTKLCKVRRQGDHVSVKLLDGQEIPEGYAIEQPPIIPPPLFDVERWKQDHAAAIKLIPPGEFRTIDGVHVSRGEHVRVW